MLKKKIYPLTAFAHEFEALDFWSLNEGILIGCYMAGILYYLARITVRGFMFVRCVVLYEH